MCHPRRLLVLLMTVALAGAVARSQAPAIPKNNGVCLAITYDTLGSNLTTGNLFWMQGGSAELTGSFFHGFGATASVLGLHTANSGGGVPVDLVFATFGPSYRYSHRHLGVFVQGLVGEAEGFAGVYPQAGGPTPSANSLAVMAGGGLDVGLSRHLTVRVVQVDYVRTQLPNSLTNVQNSLKVGVGFVVHR